MYLYSYPLARIYRKGLSIRNNIQQKPMFHLNNKNL